MIHGRGDQVLPFAHGIALSKEMKEAKLLPLEVLGMTYLAGFGMLFSALLEHTAASTPTK